MSKISKKPGMIPSLTVFTKNVPHNITEGERFTIIPPPRSPIVREERTLCSSPLPLPRSPTVIAALTPLVLHPTVAPDYNGSKKRVSDDKNKITSEKQIEKMFGCSKDVSVGKDDALVLKDGGSGKSTEKSSDRNSAFSSPSKSPNYDNTDREINEDSDCEVRDTKGDENERLRSNSVFSLNSVESSNPSSIPPVLSTTLSSLPPIFCPAAQE